MGKFRQKWTALNLFFRVCLYIAAGIIALIIILQIVVNVWGDAIIARHLKNKIKEATNSIYSIQFEDLDLSLSNRSITIHKLRIKSDTAAFQQSFSPSQKPPSSLYRGSIKKLRITGVRLFAALWGNSLHIRKILIQKPDITLLKNPSQVSGDTTRHFSSVDSSIYAAMSGRYQSLKIGKFAIRQAHGVSIQTKDTIAILGSMNLTLKNMNVDSASARSGRLFVTDDIAMDARHLMMISSNRLNKIVLKRLIISSDSRSIRLDSLQLIPRYPKFKYSKINGTQIDRISLVIPRLMGWAVDFHTLAQTGRLHIGYMEVDHAILHDFHSKIPPRPPRTLKHLYNSKLAHLNQKIKIDSIKVNASFVSYAEYRQPAPTAGKVTFENLNAIFRNVTNFPDAVKNNEKIQVYARTNVMGKGLLRVHWTFPLNTKDAFHTVRGSLSEIPLTAFNPILEYVAFVKIDHGKLNSLKFEFTGNNKQSDGTLVMNYQNLKISVLDKETTKQKGLLKNIISFFANKAVIKKGNTPKNGMRAGKISFKRNKYKSSWNFWWKSLLSGIKDTISSL